MARGWQSKSVEDQEEETAIGPAPNDEQAAELDPALASKRRKLELARFDCQYHLATARAEDHREMLRRALEALDEQIAKLSPR